MSTQHRLVLGMVAIAAALPLLMLLIDSTLHFITYVPYLAMYQKYLENI